MPSPHEAACAASARARRSWAGVRATEQRPALDEPAAQPFLAVDPADLVDRVTKGRQLGERGRRARSAGDGVGRDRPQRRDPAAVAAARAEADVLGLEDEHVQVGPVAQEVVGRPQAGVPAPDDDDVDRRAAGRMPCRAGAGTDDEAAVAVSHHSGPVDGRGVARATSEVVLGLGEHRAQAALDLLELGRTHRQRRGELHDGVAAVVGAAVEAGVEERLGQEAAQQPLGLGVVERLAGRLVLDELDAVEVAGAPDVTDEREVEQLVERGP